MLSVYNDLRGCSPNASARKRTCRRAGCETPADPRATELLLLLLNSIQCLGDANLLNDR